MTDLFKVYLIGESGVGKSPFVIMFIQKYFVEMYDPTIEDSYRRQVTVDDDLVLFDILDTCAPSCSVLTDSYIRQSDAFILLYSITSRASFQEVTAIHDQIVRAKDLESREIPCVLVGNKCDEESEREVSKDEGEQLASLWGCPFMEASAKLNKNVDEAFFTTYREYIRLKGLKKGRNQNDNLDYEPKHNQCRIS